MTPYLLDYVASLGHAVFTNGEYNLNIIGIRSADDSANTFNDRICVVYKDDQGWVTRTWECTTDPGTYYREKPINVNGTAILVPGQYRGAYKLGRHRGKYEALVQTGGRVKVYRDNNKDEILDVDENTVMDGYFGINIHKAGLNSVNVDKWSAGCQVFKSAVDFDEFIRLCKMQTWDTFTYTLIEV
tara:strand:- start:5046 stop:5603 length:558 start_codon:yes stop_codon:yes gene_type:complete